MEVTWSILKAFITARTLSIQYVDLDDTYWLCAYDGNFKLECKLYKYPTDTTDLLDFENNYKAAGNKSYSDIDGSLVVRPKAAKKGWTYSMIPIEVKTSTLSSIKSYLVDGSNRSGITLKLYDNTSTEITNVAYESTCVKTVVTFEPTFDYELVGGTCSQKAKPGSDVRIWVTAVPDIAEAYGGSKEMVGGVNLDFIDPTDKVDADGRVSKLMTYSATYHTNKLQFTLKHGAGVAHDLLIKLEVFKA